MMCVCEKLWESYRTQYLWLHLEPKTPHNSTLSRKQCLPSLQAMCNLPTQSVVATQVACNDSLVASNSGPKVHLHVNRRCQIQWLSATLCERHFALAVAKWLGLYVNAFPCHPVLLWETFWKVSQKALASIQQSPTWAPIALYGVVVLAQRVRDQGHRWGYRWRSSWLRRPVPQKYLGKEV